jgi:hypothetical protein
VGVGIRNDLIVVAVHHQDRHGDLIEAGGNQIPDVISIADPLEGNEIELEGSKRVPSMATTARAPKPPRPSSRIGGGRA